MFYESVKRMRRPPTDWGTIFGKDNFEIKVLSKISKLLLKLINKDNNNLIK